jgi:hypothetical protein
MPLPPEQPVDDRRANCPDDAPCSVQRSPDGHGDVPVAGNMRAAVACGQGAEPFRAGVAHDVPAGQAAESTSGVLLGARVRVAGTARADGSQGGNLDGVDVEGHEAITFGSAVGQHDKHHHRGDLATAAITASSIR